MLGHGAGHPAGVCNAPGRKCFRPCRWALESPAVVRRHRHRRSASTRVWRCAEEDLHLDTETWLSHRFRTSRAVTRLSSSQWFQSVKSIVSSWATQKQAAKRTWPVAPGLPTPGIKAKLVLSRDRRYARDTDRKDVWECVNETTPGHSEWHEGNEIGRRGKEWLRGCGCSGWSCQEGPLWDLNDKGTQFVVHPQSTVHLHISKHTNSIGQPLLCLIINS